jgi:hypothetical protein
VTASQMKMKAMRSDGNWREDEKLVKMKTTSDG